MKKTKRGVLTVLKKDSGKYLLIFLIALNILLLGLSVGKAKGLFIPEQPEIKKNSGSVHIDHLSLKQKIAQMTIVLGIEYFAEPLKNMQVGGIHLHTLKDEDVFKRVIGKFQENTTIPVMVTADLEGCVNPFAHFKYFTPVSQIRSLGEAFEKGKTEGNYLKSLGFTLNFAPVVDLNDTIWKCRSFTGDEIKISELANAYALGLQDEGIIATAKHYPGKTLIIKDPHKYLAYAQIDEDDLYPYQQLSDKNAIKAIMISHLITYGEVNSEGKPSVASENIVDSVRDMGFEGLIVTDEINMLGVKNFYENRDEMYIDIFKAGPDLVLNFYQDPNEIYHMIKVVEQAVKDGIISEERIDASVRRILEAKEVVVAKEAVVEKEVIVK